MSIKLLLIGDPHFKDDNVEATDLMTLNICKKITEQKPDIIAVMGDINHKHDKFDLRPYYRSEKFLKEIYVCKNINTKLIIIIGNHDRENNKDFLTDIHAFNSFKMWPNTIVVDKVNTIECNLENGKIFRIVAVPYVPEGRFAEALQTQNYAICPQPSSSESSSTQSDTGVTYKLNDVDLILAHQEFIGAKMTGIISKKGDKYPLHLPLCISGHIHDYDQLQTNIFYTGTPIQHGYADTHDKTISVFKFDLEKGGYEHIRISLDIPKKLQFILTPQELLNFKFPDNAHIKIKLKCTTEEFNNTIKLDYIKRLLTNGVKIKHQNIDQIITPIPLNDIKTRKSFKQRLYDAIQLQREDIQLTFQSIL